MLYSFFSYAGKVRLALALLNKICRLKKKKKTKIYVVNIHDFFLFIEECLTKELSRATTCNIDDKSEDGTSETTKFLEILTCNLVKQLTVKSFF